MRAGEDKVAVRSTAPAELSSCCCCRSIAAVSALGSTCDKMVSARERKRECSEKDEGGREGGRKKIVVRSWKRLRTNYLEENELCVEENKDGHGYNNESVSTEYKWMRGLD